MLKIPCGGFELDESSFSLENKKLSTQPVSWNDLKDRPFGEETVVFEKDYGNLTNGQFINDNPYKTVGEEHIVTVDGVDYTCVPQSGRMGNMSLWNDGGADTGEPFLFISGMIRFKDTTTSHHFKVRQSRESKLSLDYIPETTFRIGYDTSKKEAYDKITKALSSGRSVLMGVSNIGGTPIYITDYNASGCTFMIFEMVNQSGYGLFRVITVVIDDITSTDTLYSAMTTTDYRLTLN